MSLVEYHWQAVQLNHDNNLPQVWFSKYIAAEILKFNQEDFEKLRLAVGAKYKKLIDQQNPF